MPTLYVSRPVLDVVRALQVLIVAVALAVDFGHYEGVAEAVVAVVANVVATLAVRQASTPVTDPRVG